MSFTPAAPAHVSAKNDYGAPSIQIVCFASREVDVDDDEILQAIQGADLIVSLGNVDLERLASRIGRKPALCVHGSQDQQRQPPAPFRALHGNGVTFQGWRIAGLSGGPLSGANRNGFAVDDRDAEALLSTMPACDILLSHMPPQRPETPEGFPALAAYMQAKPPIYNFHASQAEHSAVAVGETLLVGVCGVLSTPQLIYA